MNTPNVEPTAPTLPAGVLHVDVDAFFAQVEVLDNPALAGLPVAVGHDGAAGVVATASYEARAFGVHSAMPTATAKRLCPSLVIVPGRHDRYREISALLFGVCERFAVTLEVASIDEAYLLLPATVTDLSTVASLLKDRVLSETRLRVSVGGGPSKLIAKLASKAAKPDGVLTFTPETSDAFLLTRPITDIPGVGPVTSATLAAAGVTSVAQARLRSRDELVGLLGPSSGRRLFLAVHDRLDDPVAPRGPAKSRSSERTFAPPLRTMDAVAAETERLGIEALARAGRPVQMVSVTLRSQAFTTMSHSVLLDAPSDDQMVIVAAALTLLDRFPSMLPVRLVGVTVGRFADFAQMSLPLPSRFTQVNSRVANTVFGEGTVEHREGEWLTIVFDDGSRRRILASFCTPVFPPSSLPSSPPISP